MDSMIIGKEGGVYDMKIKIEKFPKSGIKFIKISKILEFLQNTLSPRGYHVVTTCFANFNINLNFLMIITNLSRNFKLSNKITTVINIQHQ